MNSIGKDTEEINVKEKILFFTQLYFLIMIRLAILKGETKQKLTKPLF